MFKLEISNSSSDSEESTVYSNFNEETDNLDEDDTEIEPPVFDSSKENDYKIKYKTTFEEVVSLNNVYILNLDAHKQ